MAQQQTQQQPQPQQHRVNGNNNSGSSLYESYHGGSTHQRDPPPYPGHFTQFYTPGTVPTLQQLYSWFPYGLENLENGKTFSSQGILNRLEMSGKFTQNSGEMRESYLNYWKSEKI